MLRLPQRIHKRPFVVASIVFLALVIFAGLFIFILSLSAWQGEISRITLEQPESLERGSSSAGLGFSLPILPSPNLLQGSSFEKEQFDEAYTVLGGEGSLIYLQRENKNASLFTDGFFNGGQSRVMALDQNGTLLQKTDSSIHSFQPNQLGMFAPITPLDSTASDYFDFASGTDSTLAVGAKGLLITGFASALPQRYDLAVEDDFIAAAAFENRFAALTARGGLAASFDSQEWQLYDPPSEPIDTMTDLAFLNRTVLGVGDKGQILLWSRDNLQTNRLQVDIDLKTVSSDGTRALVGGSQGKLFSTANGLFFQDITAEALKNFDTGNFTWCSSTYGNNQFVFGADNGLILLAKYNVQTGTFSFTQSKALDRDNKPLPIKQILIPHDGELLILTQGGALYFSGDSAKSWSPLKQNVLPQTNLMGAATGNRILFSQDNQAYLAQLCTVVQIDDTQTDTVFQSGDLCILEVSQSPLEGENFRTEGNWKKMNDKAQWLLSPEAPAGSGEVALVLKAPAEVGSSESSFITQALTKEDGTVFQSGVFYRIDVWLRQDGIQNGEVMAWLSGNFPSQGTRFSDVGNGWRQYSFTFVPPRENSGEQANANIYFNLGFQGTGTLYIDRVYLGLESEADLSVSDSLSTLMKDSKPAYLRFENVGLGALGFPNQAWRQAFGNSVATTQNNKTVYGGNTDLESALSLAQESEANPWLIIGANMHPTTINQLMGYLCGGISDPYGRLRVENGTAIPWSQQFERIVFEISDRQGIFVTDMQRGAYVDYVINLFKASDYYLDIKDQLVFLDSMNYSGGTMLSAADYHTGALQVSNLAENDEGSYLLSWGEAVAKGYRSYFDSIPRRPLRPQSLGDEWIYSAVMNKYLVDTSEEADSKGFQPVSVSMAEAAEVLLHDLGQSTYTLLSELFLGNSSEAVTVRGAESRLPWEEEIEQRQILLAAQRALAKAAQGEAMKVSFSSPEDGSKLEESGLSAYAFKQEKSLQVVIINSGDKMLQFMIDGEWSLHGALLLRYSETGQLIERTPLKNHERLEILPGQLLVIEADS